jgi:hypothetical protein
MGAPAETALQRLQKELQSLPAEHLSELEEYIKYLHFKSQNTLKQQQEKRKIWKEKIKNLPVWSEEDLADMEESTSQNKEWKIEEF